MTAFSGTSPAASSTDGNPIRLLLVTDSYPPLIGGADMQVQMIARAMCDRGHAVMVATPWQPGLAEGEDDNGVEVRRLRALSTRVPWFAKDPARRHQPPFPDPSSAVALRRLIRSHRPDLVHSYGWISYSAAAAMVGTNLPLLLSARDYGYVCAVRNFLHYQGQVCSGPGLAKCLACAAYTYTQDDAGNAVLGRAGAPVTARNRLLGTAKGMAAVASIYLGWPLLTRRLRGVHSVSTFVRGVMDRFLLQAGTGREVHVIADAVIPSFLPPAEAGEPDAELLARLPTQPFILFVGALLPQKGIWPLIAAYRRLRAPAPPLVLLGPTSYKSPTELPEGVVALGGTSHATVMAAWDRALFGVVPSVGAETFGNVVTEAMSRGRAVVASRLGGIVDIIENERSGLLVPPGDEVALAQAMQRLLDDRALQARLGDAARERATRFAAETVLPRFEALYRDVLTGGVPGGPSR
jgi:glycosyltransferase involved in cell wall biosynthesis